MKVDETIKNINALIDACNNCDCDEDKDLADDIAIVLETAKRSLKAWEDLKNFYSDYKLPETLHTIHIDICSYNRAISDIDALLQDYIKEIEGT
jgi:hypothetical protein